MARPSLVLSAALLLSATVASAANVRTDYDHHANFSGFHTYSWGDVKTANPLYVDRIKEAVNRNLQAKGWQMVPSGGDTTIFATGSVQNEQQVETMYNGLGGGWGRGWGWGGWGGGFGGGGFGNATTTTTQKPVGNLIVDVFETSGHELVFRGITDNDVNKNADKNTKTLNKAIDQMFKNFPPKGNG